MRFHDLTTFRKMPPGTARLLGLSMSFCLQSLRPNQDIKATMKRLRDDIRRKYYFRHELNNDQNYNPKIYIKSKWILPEASTEVETCLNNFERELYKLKKKSMEHPARTNLTRQQQATRATLKKSKDWVTFLADKNLGAAGIETEAYNDRAWSDHLSDAETYKVLPENWVHATKAELRYELGSFLSKAFEELSDSEKTFFSRLKEESFDKLVSKFYLTAKVHKTPWKTRPVVATCGTFMHGLSRWADVYLQELKKFSPSYLRDSYQLLEELDKIGELDEGSKVITMDATAMYTNIETDHGLEILEKFIDMFADQLPDDFPRDLLLWAMKIIMRYNLFEFGPTILKQLCGTAMGTPCACMYATIYYAFHEITVLLAKYKEYIILYKRLIDDGFLIWNDRGDADAWANFCQDVNNFVGGKLKWIIEEPSREVNFLDITIKINDCNRIETRTYQKPMNLYLYITESSSHPRDTIKGMIFGELKRYHAQNTKREDYLEMVRLLFTRLRARGWGAELLKEWFLTAADKIESNRPRFRPDIPPRERLFIHAKYHRHGITRKEIRAAFNATCSSLLTMPGMEINQVTVALSRPTNLKDDLTSARFYPNEGTSQGRAASS
jgi:hypothetical protein